VPNSASAQTTGAIASHCRILIVASMGLPLTWLRCGDGDGDRL